MTGLYAHHYGEERNIPIVRVGNIAALDVEPLQPNPKHWPHGPIDCYLIEARSTGGLSGSPVFVNLGAVRWVLGEVRFAANESNFYMLGLMHGHFQQQTTVEPVNAGIGIVVLIDKVSEVLGHSALVEIRSKAPASEYVMETVEEGEV